MGNFTTQEKVIDKLLEQCEVVSAQVFVGRVSASSYEVLQQLALQTAGVNPVAAALPEFVMAPLDGIHSHGHFDLALHEELGVDIRRWPNLG